MLETPHPHIENGLPPSEINRGLGVMQTIAGTPSNPGYEAKFVVHDKDHIIEVESDGRGNIRGDRADFEGKVVRAAQRVDFNHNHDPEHIDTLM